MQGSMLLKTKNGQTVGYILTQGDAVCVKLDGTGEKWLIIAYADGSTEEKCISSGKEARFARNGKMVQSGAVLDEGCVLAASEKSLFCTKNNRRTDKKPERTNPPRLTAEEKENTHSQTKADETRQAREWPQPRWPKPPCMSAARYILGQWKLPEAR